MKTKTLLSVKQVEVITNFPSVNWKGNCYCIASKLVASGAIKGRAVYGHWLGDVDRHSFFRHRRHLPFIPHGWIVTEDNTIVDPTRWVFEAIDPYLYYGGDVKDPEEMNTYDEGGNSWRSATLKPVPKFNSKERLYTVVMSEDAKDHLMELIGHRTQPQLKDLSFGLMFWVGNLPPDLLGQYDVEIFQWFVNVGLGALIPIDNRIMVLGDNDGP